MVRARKTTLLIFQGMDEVDMDIQEDVSDCVYAMTMSMSSPVRQAGVSKNSLLSELNELASETLRKLSSLGRIPVVRSLTVTDLFQGNDTMRLNLRIGVTGRIDKDLTIVL